MACLFAVVSACSNQAPAELDGRPSVAAALMAAEHQKLLAADAVAGDWFGIAVSVSGETALIGAGGDDNSTGSAYVFVRSGATWIPQQKLIASDGVAYDGFGRQVSVDGDSAIVAAEGDDDQGTNSGSAYVFVRNGVTWTQQQKLTATDGMAGDTFGSAVSISGDTAFVGAEADDSFNGSAYVFVRSDGTWMQQQKLTGNDGTGSESFGSAVSISGDTALVGAYLDDDAIGCTWIGCNSGSAHVFVRNGVTWIEQQELTASDGAANDYFGRSVAISGDTALVGAYWHLGSAPGSAYVFARSGSTWTEHAKLAASDETAGNLFGFAVSVSGDTALLGAHGADVQGMNSGAAYVFQRSGGTWSEQARLVASGDAAGDAFGLSVSLVGDHALIGAYADDDLPGCTDIGCDSGSAYVFALDVGVACATEAECATGSCTDGVCCEQACTGTCERCDDPASPGRCTTVTSAVDADTCAADYACDPSGDCKLGLGSACGAGDECASTHCADGFCCDGACAGSCNVCAASLGASADGFCTLAPADFAGDPPCGSFLCTSLSAACGFNCNSDAACAPGHYCAANGTCEPRKVKGEACSVDAGDQCLNANCRVCKNSVCRSGFCCDAACDGPCGLCAASVGAPADGICALAKAGSEGDPSCAPYLCSGASATCSSACARGADCARGAHCELPAGKCVPDADLGVPCAAGAECEGGFCVDGRCCDSRCDGQCEACDVPEADGSYAGRCQAAAGEPHGGRERCSGEGECAGACDGKARALCIYPSGATACGQTTCTDDVETGSRCDGAGTCIDAAPRRCQRFACGPDGCRTECAMDSHCQATFWCEARETRAADAAPVDGGGGLESSGRGDCVPRDRAYCEGDTLVAADGTSQTPCEPYRCDKATAGCLTACASTLDCTAGGRCTSQGTCTEPAAGVPGAGCGCRVVGAPASAPPALWLLGLGALLARLRRRRAVELPPAEQSRVEHERGFGDHTDAARVRVARVDEVVALAGNNRGRNTEDGRPPRGEPLVSDALQRRRRRIPLPSPWQIITIDLRDSNARGDLHLDRDEIGRREFRVGVNERFQARQRQRSGGVHDRPLGGVPAPRYPQAALPGQRSAGIRTLADPPDVHSAVDPVGQPQEHVLDLALADLRVQHAERDRTAERSVLSGQPLPGLVQASEHIDRESSDVRDAVQTVGLRRRELPLVPASSERARRDADDSGHVLLREIERHGESAERRVRKAVSHRFLDVARFSERTEHLATTEQPDQALRHGTHAGHMALSVVLSGTRGNTAASPIAFGHGGRGLTLSMAMVGTLFVAGGCVGPVEEVGRDAAGDVTSETDAREVIETAEKIAVAGADDVLVRSLRATTDGWWEDDATGLGGIGLAASSRRFSGGASPSAATGARKAAGLAGQPFAEFTSPGWRSARMGPGYEIGARLPERADGAIEIGIGQSDRYRMRLVPEGARAVAGAMHDGRVVYAGAYRCAGGFASTCPPPHRGGGLRRGTDVVVTASPSRVELLYVVREPVETVALEWRVELGESGTGRREGRKGGNGKGGGFSEIRPAFDGGLEVLDDGGNVRLRMPMPYAIDARGERRDAVLAIEDGRVRVELDARGMAAPVLLDPAIEVGVWVAVGPPTARSQHALAHDAARGRTVLFGGYSGGYLSDTWEWDGMAWTLRATTGPPARRQHALAYDAARQRTVLFGGYDNGTMLGDTWEWDGTA